MERNPTVRIIPAKEENIRIEKVGIYARVSTAGKAQLRSLATQISGLTRYVAKQEGWLLTDIYMDVDSAKTGSDRREFTRLLTDCKNHDLDYVITKSMSRFGRDNVEVLKAVRLLQESGVKIYFMEEDLDVDKNYDELELTIRTAINQSENEHRSENIRMGMKFRAEIVIVCGMRMKRLSPGKTLLRFKKRSNDVPRRNGSMRAQPVHLSRKSTGRRQ